MRIFGCSVRHSAFARSVAIQTTPLWRRASEGIPCAVPGPPRPQSQWRPSAAPKLSRKTASDSSRNVGMERPDRLTVPHLDRRVRTSRSAAPGSPVPGAALRLTIAMRLKTEIRLGLQLFCDCGLSWTPLIANHGAKAQVIGRTAAYFRLEGAEKSPQPQKSCKNGGIFVFDGPIVAIGQIQQRANRPNRADPAKGTRGLGDPGRANPTKDTRDPGTPPTERIPRKRAKPQRRH